MRLSTTPPFFRPAVQTSASPPTQPSSKASPQAANNGAKKFAPAVPDKKSGLTPPENFTTQSRGVTGDDSLARIMEEFRRAAGVQTRQAAQSGRPKLLTQDSNFSEMMQVARSASEGPRPTSLPLQMSAEERAVRRVVTKVNAWWQAKVGGRRWLGGGRRAGTSAGAVATVPASVFPADAPPGEAKP